MKNELLEFPVVRFYFIKEYTMNIKNVLITILILIITCSCSIQGSFQGLFSYYKKVNKESPTLIRKVNKETLVCNVNYSDSCRVLLLNGKDLAQCIKKEKKTILYLWAANCHSPYCYGLDRVQAYCKEKKIKLYVIADYYDNDLMNEYYNLEYPIIGIDTKYYKTNFTSTYKKKFLADLSIIEKDYHRLLYLENGKFIKSFRVLDEIQ